MIGRKARWELVRRGQVDRMRVACGSSCVFSLYTSFSFDVHVTNSIYPSVSGHPAHLSNVCLPCKSPSACEPPASLLSLDLTLDPPREGALSVPSRVPCVPQHQPPPSRPRLSRRPRPLSSHSWSRLYRSRFESHTRSLLSLRLPRFQSQALRPPQSTFYRPSRQQSHWRPSQGRQPLWS